MKFFSASAFVSRRLRTRRQPAVFPFRPIRGAQRPCPNVPRGVACPTGTSAGWCRVRKPTLGDLKPLYCRRSSRADKRTTSLGELRDALARHEPGDEVEIKLYRGNDEKTVTVKLGRQSSSPRG